MKKFRPRGNYQKQSSEFYAETHFAILHRGAKHAGEISGHAQQWSDVLPLFNIHGVGNEGKTQPAPVVPKEEKNQITT